MSRSSQELIAALAADARPVRRLKPPGLRAAVWLVLLVGLCALFVALKADLPLVLARNAGLRPMTAWAASLLTGVTAVIAAAHLSLPDRSRRWALLPLPFLALWVGLSGIGCLGLTPEPLGDSRLCFLFILAVGTPFTGFLLWRLQRAHPLDARLVAAMGALGAAGLSAALLQFFHEFTITFMDLGAHLAAAAVIVLGGSVIGSVTGARDRTSRRTAPRRSV